MKTKNQSKYTNIYTIMFVLMSIVFTSIIIFFVSMKSINLQKIEYKIVSSLEIKHKQELIQEYYSDFEIFLQHIYKNKNFISYLNNQTAADEKIVIELFKTLSGSNKEITQLRYINENGQEVIRVNRDQLGSSVYLVQQSKLQDKKHRNYFLSTMKKNDGELNLSNLELNIENKKIVTPYSPILRFSIPVYAHTKPKGILIVNIFSQKLLEKLLYSVEFNVDIFDQDNEILVSSLDNNWSRDLKRKSTLNKESFIASQKLIESKSGETLYIGLTPKENHTYYYKYLDKQMFVMIGLMIIVSIFAAMYLARIPQKLLYELFIKDKTIDENIMFYRINKSGTIVEVSELFSKYSGYLKDELIGKKHEVLIHEDASEEIYKEFLGVIDNNKAWHNQVCMTLRENQKGIVDMKMMPEYDENNKLVGYISIVEDVAEQQKNIKLMEEHTKLLQMTQDSLMFENETLLENEQNLMNSLEDLEIFFNTIPTPYIIISQDLNIKYWNTAAENAFNLSRILKVEIRPLGVLLDNFSQIDFINYLKDLAYKQRPYNVKVRFKDKASKAFRVHVTDHPTDQDSYIIAFSV